MPGYEQREEKFDNAAAQCRSIFFVAGCGALSPVVVCTGGMEPQRHDRIQGRQRLLSLEGTLPVAVVLARKGSLRTAL